MTDSPNQIHFPLWLRIAAIWFAASLVDGSQFVLWARSAGQDLPWPPIYATAVLSWIPWALATVPISALARKFPLAPRSWSVRGTAVHAFAVAALSLVGSAWVAWVERILNPRHLNHQHGTFVDAWSHDGIDQAVTFLIIYSLIVAVTYVIDSHENLAHERTEAVRLSEQLSRAELATLRQQIEPHFLFNTLNSIVALVRDQRGDAAVDMIVRLSEFLRRTTADSNRSQVTLAEEVDYLKRYLDIQKLRFGDRLHVSVNIPSELLVAIVPYLTLQPLVENGIKHGLGQRAAGGDLRIAGVRIGTQLSLRVYNDGPALTEGTDARGVGIGLGNLRTRLRILHGEAASVELRNASPAGVEASVILPFVES